MTTTFTTRRQLLLVAAARHRKNWVVRGGILTAVLFLHGGPAGAQSSGLDPSFGTDGTVVTAITSSRDIAYGAAIQADGKIVAVGEAGSALYFGVVRYNLDGSLDSGFGTNGIVTTTIGSLRSTSAHAVAIQPDGKIVVVGTAGVVDHREFAVVRHDVSGMLDTTFGGGDGIVTTNFTEGASQGGIAYAVAVQADGKIVVAGHANGAGRSDLDFALARYNSDGSLDPTFDGDGKLTTPFLNPFFFTHGSDSARDVVIQPDGKIVAVGYGPPFAFAAARYNADGTLDASFGTAGQVITDVVSGRTDQAYGVALQSDGKIVVGGLGNDADFAIVRYLPNGSLDPSFDGEGKVLTDATPYDDLGRDVVVQADGKIIIGGYSLDPDAFDWDFGLVRYNSDGSLDTTFDCDGIARADLIGNDNFGFALALQLDGYIIAAGSTDPANATGDDFVLARFLPVGVCGSVDADGDAIDDATDNCPLVANADQSDADADGQGDACDADDDNDGLADAAEAGGGTDPLSGDTDGDGVSDGPADPDGAGPVTAGPDNCPTAPNSDQTDTDSDGRGDACDADDDNDGVGDGDDAFPLDPSESADTDEDGIGDNADRDDDGDGQSDVDEAACGSDSLDSASRASDADNDGRPDCVDVDDDNDGVLDPSDNCPSAANASQQDSDGDGIGDACDPNPNDGPRGDLDGDGVMNSADNCPLTANANQRDLDGDGIGDACDALIGPPTDKEQCKNGGWRVFNQPFFKNQGACVSAVVSRKP